VSCVRSSQQRQWQPVLPMLPEKISSSASQRPPPLPLAQSSQPLLLQAELLLANESVANLRKQERTLKALLAKAGSTAAAAPQPVAAAGTFFSAQSVSFDDAELISLRESLLKACSSEQRAGACVQGEAAFCTQRFGHGEARKFTHVPLSHAEWIR
jgi:hypothetical protein